MTKTNENKKILEFFRNLKRNDELANAIESVYKERYKYKLKKVRL